MEKIRTIGDGYMVASGVPAPREDHARALACLALDMMAYAASDAAPEGLVLRIGISSGPLVAGVIGTRKFCYDVWGDTVNLASRMEALGSGIMALALVFLNRIEAESPYAKLTLIFAFVPVCFFGLSFLPDANAWKMPSTTIITTAERVPARTSTSGRSRRATSRYTTTPMNAA